MVLHQRSYARAFTLSFRRLCRARKFGGCDFAETPEVEAPSARVFWDESVDHSVLTAVARRATDASSAFDVCSLAKFAVVLSDPTGEYLSLSNGMSRITLRLICGSFLDGPVSLDFIIADARASAQIQALTRFRSLRQRGKFGPWLHRREVRTTRWIRELRTFDALTAGASVRDIAAALFGEQRAREQWRDRDGSLRSVVRRLVSVARRNVAGGYRDLLREVNAESGG